MVVLLKGYKGCEVLGCTLFDLKKFVTSGVRFVVAIEFFIMLMRSWTVGQISSSR